MIILLVVLFIIAQTMSRAQMGENLGLLPIIIFKLRDSG